MKPRPEDPDANIRLDVASVRPRIRRRGAWIGSAAVVAVIALQVAVPMVALLLPPPQRFGFQMYSGLGGVTVSVVDDEGDADELNDVEQIVGKLRPDIDWLQFLPEAVCTAVPDAPGVRVQQAGRERTVECN